MMSQKPSPLATSAAAAPGLLTQVGMAGSAAVITVSFIHPIDVVKVRRFEQFDQRESDGSNVGLESSLRLHLILFSSSSFCALSDSYSDFFGIQQAGNGRNNNEGCR